MYTTEKQVQRVLEYVTASWLEDRPISFERARVQTGLSVGVLRQALLQLHADGRLIMASDSRAGERHPRPAGLSAAGAEPPGGWTLAHALQPYLEDQAPTAAEKAKVCTAVRAALAAQGRPVNGHGVEELLRVASSVSATDLRLLPEQAARRQARPRGADNLRYGMRALLRYAAERRLVPVLCESERRDMWDEWVWDHAHLAPRPHEFLSVHNSLRAWLEAETGTLPVGLTPAMLSAEAVTAAREQAVKRGIYKPASARVIVGALRRFGRDLGIGPFHELIHAVRDRGGPRGTTPRWWLQTDSTTPGIESLLADCASAGLPADAADFASWVWRFHRLSDAQYAQSPDMPTPRVDKRKREQTVTQRLRAFRAAWGALLCAGHAPSDLTPEYVLAVHGEEMLALVAEHQAGRAANTRRNVYAALSVLAGLALVWRHVRQTAPARLRIRTRKLRDWYNGIAALGACSDVEQAYLSTRNASTARAEEAEQEAQTSRPAYCNAVPMVQMAWMEMAEVLDAFGRTPNRPMTTREAHRVMVLTAMAVASLGATRSESIALLRLDRHANETVRRHAAPHLLLDGRIQKYARGLLSATHWVPLTQGLDRLFDLYVSRARPVLVGDVPSPYVFVAPGGESFGDEDHEQRTDRGAQALSRLIQSMFAELLVKHGHPVPSVDRALGPHQTRNDVATMGIKRNVPSARIDIVLLNHKPRNQTDKSYHEKDPHGVTQLLHDIFGGQPWWEAMAPHARPRLSIGQQQRLDAPVRRVFVRCDATPKQQRELATFGHEAIAASLSRVLAR